VSGVDIKTEALQRAKEELEKRLNRTLAVSASNLCTHCGWCIDTCHYYKATKDPHISPVAKAEKVRRIYKKEHDWLSKVFPKWTGAKELTEKDLDELVEVAYRNCTMCQRCTVNCPLAVDTAQILGAARAALNAAGKSPEILVQLADAAIAREESMDFFKEFYLEQIAELEKEVQERLGNPSAKIPMEVQGARFLYVPLAGAHTIVPPAIVFNAMGESWTMSMFDAANYGVYLNDRERSKKIADRIVKEATRLGVQEVIVAECGHAYVTLRWEAPTWFDKPWPFKVRSLVEVIDEYVREGKLHLSPDLVKEPLTYHDSCNLGRNGGMFEAPRRVLAGVATDFRDMNPNREQNLCCGAGGGLIAMEEWRDMRLTAGKPKADQIKATGAKVVIASCDNCRHQLNELNEHYDLGVQVFGVAELVANALTKE